MKKIVSLVLFILLVIPVFDAQASQDLEIVTGEHWIDSSLEQRRAYIFGVGNMLEIEQAMAGDDFDSMRGRSIVPVLLEGLSAVPISNIVMQLDKYYADHPDQLDRPVIEVLYLEMALPNMQN